MYGHTAGSGSTIRPATCHWHMVLLKLQGVTRLLMVGPLTSAGRITFDAGAELLWIQFCLGAFIPHLPLRDCLDAETMLPTAATKSFWLKGAAWQFPTPDNVEPFIARLAKQEILVHDPLIDEVLQAQPQDVAPRTVRHRFLQATGVTQSHIRQVERAQQAAALLQQGVSILDTVEIAGYFDQPHLTRALKQWIGYTPAQLIQRHSLIPQ
jgi:AraC-like DNA-binding protein